MAGYPLLTKVLADAMAKRAATVTTRDTSVWGRQEGQFTIAAIPPDIADRLERALDVCQRMDPDPAIGQCGEPEASEVHHRDLSVWPSESFWAHPFVPLVTP